LLPHPHGQPSDETFQTIGARETIEVQLDVTQLHDLSAGGEFNISTEGSLHYAKAGDTKIADQVVCSSNTIQASIDGAEAAKAHKEDHASDKAKRMVSQSDCSSLEKSVVNAASAGTKLQEYSKSISSGTASTVVGVFSKIANNVVNRGTSGSAKLYCTDVGRWCIDGAVAYTQPGSNEYVSHVYPCAHQPRPVALQRLHLVYEDGSLPLLVPDPNYRQCLPHC
jgi:deuterolysin